MAIPNATVKITNSLKKHRSHADSKGHRQIQRLEVVPVEPETDRKIAGKDKTTPAPINAPVRLGEVFFVGFSPNISPDKNRIANVPMPTANWKIAAKIAPFRM